MILRFFFFGVGWRGGPVKSWLDYSLVGNKDQCRLFPRRRTIRYHPLCRKRTNDASNNLHPSEAITRCHLSHQGPTCPVAFRSTRKPPQCNLQIKTMRVQQPCVSNVSIDLFRQPNAWLRHTHQNLCTDVHNPHKCILYIQSQLGKKYFVMCVEPVPACQVRQFCVMYTILKQAYVLWKVVVLCQNAQCEGYSNVQHGRNAWLYDMDWAKVVCRLFFGLINLWPF